MSTLGQLLAILTLFAALFATFQPWLDAAEQNLELEENEGDTTE